MEKKHWEGLTPSLRCLLSSSSLFFLRPKTLSLAGFSLSIFVVGGVVVWWAAKSWLGAHALFTRKKEGFWWWLEKKHSKRSKG